MTSLAALQRAFQHAVIDGDDSIRDEIEETARVRAKTRIGIYADAYRLRLAEALEDNYPTVHGMLGDERFESLVRRYIEAQPSTFRSIRWFGGALPAFIEANEHAADVAGVPLQALRETALVDWRMSLAFDAADVETASEADMTAIAPEHWGALAFNFHPSVQRLDLAYNVFQFRKTVRGEEGGDAALERGDAPVPWLIWRRDLGVRYRSMSIDEAFAVDAAIAGESFAVLCAGLTEWIDEPNVAMRAVALLKRWLVDGLIARVNVQAG